MGEPAERLKIAEGTAAPAAKDLGWTLHREVRQSNLKLAVKDAFAELWRRSGGQPVPVRFALEEFAAVIGTDTETIRRALEFANALLLDVVDRPRPGRSIGPALWMARPRDPHDLTVHRVLVPGPWRWLPGVNWEDPWGDADNSSNRGIAGATGGDLQQPASADAGDPNQGIKVKDPRAYVKE